MDSSTFATKARRLAEIRAHECGDYNNWSRGRTPRQRFQNHLNGARAEYAASLLFGASEPKWNYVPGEPDLWDQANDRWIEVKWISEPTHSLIVQRRQRTTWLGKWVWVACLCGEEMRLVYFRRWVDEFLSGSPPTDAEGRNWVVTEKNVK